MTALRRALAFGWVACVALAWVRMQADGVLVLGTVLFVAWLAACGMFTGWMADDETSARWSAVDEEIRFAEDVRADIARLDARD